MGIKTTVCRTSLAPYQPWRVKETKLLDVNSTTFSFWHPQDVLKGLNIKTDLTVQNHAEHTILKALNWPKRRPNCASLRAYTDCTITV